MSSYFYLKKLPPTEPVAPNITTVPIEAALGLELSEDVNSMTDIPPYSQALRDGWAVRSSESGPWRSAGNVENGLVPEGLPCGCCMHINTGGYLPEGADCVIAEKEAHCLNHLVFANQNFHYVEENTLPEGCEWKKGDLLLRQKQLLGAAEIALLTDANVKTVSVLQKPRISILATGSEIAEQCESRVAQGIRQSSNGIYLTHLLKTLALPVQHFHIIPDDAHRIAEELSTLAADSDYIVTIGGTGKGQKDLIRSAIRLCDGTETESATELTDSLPFVEAQLKERRILGLPGNPLGFISLIQRVLLPRLWRFYRTVPLPYPSTHAELGFNIDAKPGEICVELAQGNNGWVALPVMKGTGRTGIFQKVSGVIPNPHGLSMPAGSQVLVELFISSHPAHYAFI